MYIELMVGAIGAILITGLFVRRENNRKNQRGKVLTKTLIKESIVPLRDETRKFIDLVIHESKNPSTANPQKLVQAWNTFKAWKKRISPLFAVSGDVIDAKQQVLLGKILEDLEMKLDFTYIELDQSHLHGLDKNLTDYLKMNRDLVIEVNNDLKSLLQERIKKIKKEYPKSQTGKRLEFYKHRIEENEEFVKDIIYDKS